MRKVKEVLRLRYDLQLSYSQIRRSCGISNGSLNGLLTRAAKLGLTGWAACCMEVGGTVGSAAVPAARVLSRCRTRPMPAAVIISHGRSGG